ncbi:hypothetical protein A7E78_11475 [Syntrophotalea acetylenivorans]|uniref:Uncharacterized protein n=1 Tax=Syntrophotalea acetylenivorans TaxID=1842532 RepID=A0A1L3GR61_9BACT|nr:hypothetical protein [Syntrophotalea acetylenivorans]APG28414.1 hypothetical protein A7E78_11475 [Syntrophotalea acetylenivorans]
MNQHPPENHSYGLIRDVLHKTSLWGHALTLSRFYLFGEIGNLMYTIGKSILEGAVLYTMFSMAEGEYKVAAILGVLTKYIYPGITFVSSVKVSVFVDYLESLHDQRRQLAKLIRAMTLIGGGQALGAIMLVLCYPPFFSGLFGAFDYSKYLLILLYLLHHVCDGSAQVAEGRVWFKLIEIKIRHGRLSRISDNFWGIHAMSQNIQLILGLTLLWGTTLVTGLFRDRLDAGVMWGIVIGGMMLTALAKFALPLAWKLNWIEPKASP